MIFPPLVSARAYHDVRAERDRLREQNATLTAQLVRIARRAEGMPEIAPERRRKSEPPLPPKVRSAIGAWDNPAIRKEAERKARTLMREDASEGDIVAAVAPEGEAE